MYSEKLEKVCNAINRFYNQKTWYTDTKHVYISYDKSLQKLWIMTPKNSYSISWNYHMNDGYITIFNAKSLLSYKFKIEHLYKDILKALNYVFKLCEFEHGYKNPMKNYSHVRIC